MLVDQHEENNGIAGITSYALFGNPSSTTMRVKGRIHNHEVVSLLDSGSTHNFIDATILPILKLPLDSSQLLDLKVADGNVIRTLGVCHAVILLMQGHKFTIDFNVLHLGGWEVVLGTQWLCTLGVSSWDFQLMTMEFCHLGKRVFLQGLKPTSSSFQDADRFFTGSARKGLVLQITDVKPATAVQSQLPATLSDLLDEYSKVFEMPSSLPPICGHEHGITLKEGSQLMCERPYRYPYFQKFEIEKIVNELLDLGSIQPS